MILFVYFRNLDKNLSKFFGTESSIEPVLENLPQF